MYVALLLAAVAGQTPVVRVAVPAFTTLNIEAKAATFYTDHFAQQLGDSTLKVTSMNEISALLGLERQKQLLNCASESTSCMAELAAALGVDGMVRASLGRFDDVYQVNLKVISSRDAETLGAWSRSVKGERELVEALTEAASALRKDVLKAFAARRAKDSGAAVEEAPAEVESTGRVRRWAWAPAALGVLAGAGGAALLVSAQGRVDALNRLDTAAVGSDPAGYAGQARTERTFGVVSASVGAVALAAAAAMFALDGEPEMATFAVLFAPGAAAVSVGGRF